MWDDDFDGTVPSAKAPTISDETGFSVGRGRGFGMSNMKNSLPQVGDKSSFSSAPATNTDDSGWTDDAWEDNSTQNTTNNNTNSWNNNNSNSYSNNYNSSNNDYKSKSSGGCFKCGQQGHRSRDCPSGDGGGDKKRGTCFKCSQEGHMARDCPNEDSNKRSNNCFNCGEGGHMSRDCTKPKNNEKKLTCFNCGEEGHRSNECSNPKSNSGGGGGPRKCYKCNEEGHMSRECPNPDSGGGGGGGGGPRKCFKCNEEGHMSRECPNSDGGGGGGGGGSKKCFKCNEEGHMSRECPNSDGDGGGTKCYRCNEMGHISKDCPNPESDKKLGPDGKPKTESYVPPDEEDDSENTFQSVSAGINFSKYDSIAVDVTGDDKPEHITDFKNANLSKLLQDNIERAGYKVPTPIQKYCIPIVMKKRDVMACAETGSGKTAAFLLPILHNMITDADLPNNSNNMVQEPIALILSPTRELAIQINKEAKKFAYDSVVKTEVIYGGVAVWYHTNRIKQGIHILVATPGRLHDFVEKGKVSFANLRYLVLDEADRMLDMGFMPAIEKIVENPDIPPKDQRQTLMFSATFPSEIQRLACKFLSPNYLFVTVGNIGGANSDVKQTFFKLGQYEKRQKLMDILKESGNDRILVFVEQKRTADFLASFTSQNDIPTTSIHGDRLQREREEALRDFRAGKMPVLVATAVAARGLDIKDVRHVINYDLPKTIDEYVHRIGRTGRVGNLGKATSFYDPDENQELARNLKKILIDAQQEIPDWLHEEANQAVGTSVTYSGSQGNFRGRDVRNQGHTRTDANDAWDSSNNFSQPVEAEETWD